VVKNFGSSRILDLLAKTTKIFKRRDQAVRGAFVPSIFGESPLPRAGVYVLRAGAVYRL
jgi:hypothetical protein